MSYQEKNNLKIPTPLKMNDRVSALDMTWVYLMELKDNYMLEKNDSDNLEAFVRYCGIAFQIKAKEIMETEKMYITGVEGDKVALADIIGKPGNDISIGNKIEAIQGVAEFLFALVRYFQQENSYKKNSLLEFLAFAQKYVKKELTA